MQDMLRKLCSCSQSRTFCFIILLGVSLAFNAIQLVGMHAVLPDGLVRGHGRRVVPRTWPHMSDVPEAFAPDVKHAVHTEARQPEAVAAEAAVVAVSAVAAVETEAAVVGKRADISNLGL